ncbi:hypothetical protein HK100_003956 [Physocladia obscura]|uniref:Uncharacterized protein n=1 Tax=Physocladia obscura TaxID=109957 RepID=A0AAD5TCH4_9FUNG|nr:hypothetical protein HK100_003956 [Physocladia obscura]
MDLTMNTEETIALDEAVRCLIAQQQALQQTIANQETNLEAFQHTITEQHQMPSVKPLEFSGNFKGKTGHELQNSLDDYLNRSLELCQLYNFARTIGTATHAGQPTYVQFVSSGLTGCARIAWRQLTEQQRTEATWDFCKQWIQCTFSSTLTLSQAVETMEDLHQTGAVTQYSAAKLVSAISAAGVTYPEQHLC